MGLFDAYLKNYSKPGPGVNEPVPKKGPKRYWHLLKNHFTKMTGINLLYAVMFVPVYAAFALRETLGIYALLFLALLIFMPAFRTACTRAMMMIARRGNCFVLYEFKKEVFADFFKRLFASICILILPVAYWYLVSMTGNILGFGTAVGFTAIVFVIFAYLFPMWAITDIPVGKCVKNAILLTMLEWKKSLLIIAGSLVPSVVCFLFLPFSVPILVLVLYALTWLFEAMLVNTALVKHNIIPEASDDEEEAEETEEAETENE